MKKKQWRRPTSLMEPSLGSYTVSLQLIWLIVSFWYLSWLFLQFPTNSIPIKFSDGIWWHFQRFLTSEAFLKPTRESDPGDFPSFVHWTRCATRNDGDPRAVAASNGVYFEVGMSVFKTIDPPKMINISMVPNLGNWSVKFGACFEAPWSFGPFSPPRTTPFGPYGGLLQGFLHPDRQSETPDRLEALGAGSGAADVEYEQFLKAKEVRWLLVNMHGRYVSLENTKLCDLYIELWLGPLS